MITALHDADAGIRINAAWSLGQLGRASSEIITTLITALQDTEARVRSNAAWSLGQLGQISPEVVAGLREALDKANSWQIRRDSARFLSWLSQGDKTTLDALWNGLLDRNDEVRIACTHALVRLGSQSSIIAQSLATGFLQAIRDPKFDHCDQVLGRPAYDYAYEGLWLLVADAEAEE